MQTTYIITQNFDLENFAKNLSVFLEGKKLSVQKFQAETNKWVVQAREDATWKKYLSMDKAITVKISQSSNSLSVEIGSGKWIDKAAGVAVGWFLFWPTLVTSAIGTYQQMQLPKEIDAYIAKYMSEYSVENNCVSRFCSNCGNRIENNSDIFCASCGNKI